MMIMKKNAYIAPDLRNLVCESEQMIAASNEQFNQEEDSQNVILKQDEFSGAFSSRGLWTDDEEAE